MNRRHFLSLMGVSPALAAVSAQGQGFLRTSDLTETARPVWEAWKSAYLRNDGRVVDVLQNNASHSEGQGYGAVLATEFNDREAFTGRKPTCRSAVTACWPGAICRARPIRCRT